MKRWLIRAASLTLALVLLGTCASAAVLRESRLPLADSVTLSSACVDGDGTVSEHVVTYSPGGDVTPMVVYGSTLYGRSTMDYIQNYLADRGLTAVAAVNASFFDMSNGVPIGMVATDGVLRSSGSTTAVGFRRDGSVEIGQPGVAVELSYDGGQVLIHYNKTLTKGNGIVLYSRDYDEKTKNTVSAYNLILSPETDALPLSGGIRAKVLKIEADKASCSIPLGCFVLSLATEAENQGLLQSLRTIAVGDTVTITTSIASGWEDMAYVVGGGDMLVENGRVLGGFTLDTAEKAAPRTALGVRADGRVVLYTVDKSKTSSGMDLAALARRMAELGCVTAVNLDGGGSTCVGVTFPGETAFTTVNEPSDGRQRACANYLFLVRPTTRAGAAKKLFVYPYDQAVLPGGQLELTVKAVDGNYMAAAVPGNVSYTAVGGTVSGNVFTAGRAGTATVTAMAGGLSGSASVLVVETPTAIQVKREDLNKTLTGLTLENDSTLDLTAEAQYLGAALAARDTSFTWAVSPEVGTVTAEGVLATGSQNAAGELTVTCGRLTATIPVEVRANPFVDMKNHWAKEYVSTLYFQGVLQGSENGQGQLAYRPDASMTRQEFVVALMRYLGVDTASYAGAELPFADQSKIADWAMDAMKTAYRLGYLNGSERGGKRYADPTATISREEAMVILARTLNASSDSDALDQFTDENQVSDWAREALTAMVERGVVSGADGKLMPRSSVTRAAVAKMLFAMQAE